MSQVFKDNGEVVPVTVVKVEPCIVSQVKTVENDGYTSVQIGCEEKDSITKPEKGHLKGLKPVSTLSEFRVEGEELSKFQRGQVVTVKIFNEGELVKVTGISKGKGFAGVVKRHHFAGQSTSHGTKDQVRMPGSSGMGGVQRVFKNTRKPGRMGGDQITVANLEIVKKDEENNLLYIKGAVPGSRHSLVSIYTGAPLEIQLEMMGAAPAVEKTVEPQVEAVVTPAEAPATTEQAS